MRSASNELRENLAAVRERIDVAAARAGCRSQEITLLAVSKTHSAQKIQELYEAGIRHFGENRVQERESKLALLSAPDATWHMIGHLQKNKAALAAALFDSVDSLDSIALAEKLSRAREDLISQPVENGTGNGALASSPRRKPLRVLIEIKLDPEPAKSGVHGDEAPRLIETVQSIPHLELVGLMGVPPYFDNPEDARPYFRRLRELRNSLRSRFSAEALPVLSMGMSHDLEIAIQEGATEVRVGTALFGHREMA
jgi:PLP dependent protein